ncbi:MAG: DNA repair protein RecN [Nitrospirota bacterium]
MLKELNIKNFAIIDQLRVEFEPGLNVLTGETGAGKSIIVDALNLALGERASADLIRTGCQEAVVEAAFDVSSMRPLIATLLSEQGIGMEDGEDLIVRRVLSASGKNKVYINGSLATLATLAGLGTVLADIHGQHEHQSLLSLERQMEMLDSFGKLEGLRLKLADSYVRFQTIKNELADIEAGERDRAQREDMLRFQKQEIEAAALKPGEDEDLVNEQKILANAEKLAGLSRAADEALYSSESAALTGLKKAMTHLRDIAAIDNRLLPALNLCEAGKAQIEEAAREVAAYADKMEFDPDRLEQIGDRIDLMQKLKKKYGGTIEDIIAFGSKASAELERIEHSTEEKERLQAELQTLRSDLTGLAKELTRKRVATARELEKKTEAELAHLGMSKTKLVIAVTQEPGGDTLDGHKVGMRGADRVEFLIAPNPGEEPRQLARIASGGELSRIMLALKTLLLEDGIPTLVFDEVDAGIGGSVAEEVGRKLKQVSRNRQAFCITHLAQIASMAEHHYGIRKTVLKDRTNTEVRLLTGKDRVQEVARMIGGKTITSATLTHAEEMIERGLAI